MTAKKSRSTKIISLLSLLFLVCFASLLLLTPVLIARERKISHYPAATLIYERDNYQTLPQKVHWNDAFWSDDSMNNIVKWYEEEFGLHTLSGSTDLPPTCHTLEGLQQIPLKRTMRVVICDSESLKRKIIVIRTLGFQ